MGGVYGAPAGAAITLSSLSVSPSTVVGGSGSIGAIALTGAALGSGASVVVSSSNTNIATVVSPVVVASGTASRTFVVTTKPVIATAVVTITASYGGVSKSATLTVTPPTLSTLNISPVSVVGGAGSTALIRLTGLAAANVSVAVASSNTNAATVTSPVLVATGAYSKTFAITTKPVATATVVTITASYGGVSRSATLTVTPPALSSLAVTPVSVVGGAASSGILTLNGFTAASGAIVAVTSSNTSAATVASPVLVPGGSYYKTFAITTKPVATATVVTITATYGGISKTATLTVTAPPAALSALTISPASVGGGASSVGTISLTGITPPAGASVAVASSNTNVATVVSPVVVASGTVSKTFSIVTKPVTVGTVVTISATYAGVTKTATLTVTPIALASVTATPYIVIGGNSSVGAVNLNGPAPAAGASVIVTSSNSSLATVVSPALIAAGTASRTFTIVTKPVNSSTVVTITASYSGVTKTTTLTVAPAPPPPPASSSVSYVGNIVAPSDINAQASLLACQVNSRGALSGTMTVVEQSGQTHAVAIAGTLSSANVMVVKYNTLHSEVTLMGQLQTDTEKQILNGVLQAINADGSLGSKASVNLGLAATAPGILGTHSGMLRVGVTGALLRVNVAANATVLYHMEAGNGVVTDGIGYLDKNNNLFGTGISQGGADAMTIHFGKTSSGYALSGSSWTSSTASALTGQVN
ncbi:MAG: hypothetical protein ABIY70_09200 [Capsulimonas sp.]|uniref:beta strand repeat-containing protein n=1 Tax=Capsulimonas sp. TaxID=2494211 RepID=UPI0032655393